MQQHAATFQVFQEANTEARAFSRAFNQPRNVGHDEALFVIHTYHAQAWYQRGERIIGNFRLRRGYRTDKRRFTGIWHTQHTDIRQQHQFQQQIALITRCPHRFLTRSTVDRGFETGVTQAVPAAFSDHQTLTMFRHVAHGFAGALIDNSRTDRHFNRNVFTAFTGAIAARAILTTFRTERFFKTVIDQRVQVFVGFHPYVAAITAITAVRAAFWNIFFTAEAHATITAITCNDQNRCFINKLHFTLRKSFA